MDIKTREDALSAPPTPRYKLKAFERRIANLKIYDQEDFIKFLYTERCENVYDPVRGFNEIMKEYNLTGRLHLSNIRYIGEPLGCDFQFRKDARSREIIIGEKAYIVPQRFHCRVYLNYPEIVVVSETEINPDNIGTGILHLLETRGLLKDISKPEHRIIRIQYRKKTWIQRLFSRRRN